MLKRGLSTQVSTDSEPSETHHVQITKHANHWTGRMWTLQRARPIDYQLGEKSESLELECLKHLLAHHILTFVCSSEWGLQRRAECNRPWKLITSLTTRHLCANVKQTVSCWHWFLHRYQPVMFIISAVQLGSGGNHFGKEIFAWNSDSAKFLIKAFV